MPRPGCGRAVACPRDEWGAGGLATHGREEPGYLQAQGCHPGPVVQESGEVGMTPLKIIPEGAGIRLEKVRAAGWSCVRKPSPSRVDGGSDKDGGRGGERRSNIGNTWCWMIRGGCGGGPRATHRHLMDTETMN